MGKSFQTAFRVTAFMEALEYMAGKSPTSSAEVFSTADKAIIAAEVVVAGSVAVLTGSFGAGFGVLVVELAIEAYIHTE